MDPPAVVIDAAPTKCERIGRRRRAAVSAPNCTARPKQQLQVLVADEIYTIKNHAQLEQTLSGAAGARGAQRDVFERCFESTVRLEIRGSWSRSAP